MNAVNIATVAAWKIHCEVLSSSRLSHLEFRCEVEVVAGLLKSMARLRLGGPTLAVSLCVSLKRFQHFIESTY